MLDLIGIVVAQFMVSKQLFIEGLEKQDLINALQVDYLTLCKGSNNNHTYSSPPPSLVGLILISKTSFHYL